MKRKNIIWFMCMVAGIYFTSCESNDYINDGGRAQRFVNMTTYDFLKSHGSFDSLVAIIDHAGMKDIVNTPNITFFASTDYSVAPYVAAKKQKKVIEVGDENIDFGIHDIAIGELDSLKMYLFEGAFVWEYLSTENEYYTSLFGEIENSRFLVKLRRTLDYSDYVDYVDYVNFTKVIGRLDSEVPPGEVIPPQEVDMSFDCQTAGIITTTGIINVLPNSHRLMFNRESTGSN